MKGFEYDTNVGDVTNTLPQNSSFSYHVLLSLYLEMSLRVTDFMMTTK